MTAYTVHTDTMSQTKDAHAAQFAFTFHLFIRTVAAAVGDVVRVLLLASFAMLMLGLIFIFVFFFCWCGCVDNFHTYYHK